MTAEEFTAPEYTGQETTPDQKVTVWQLNPSLGTSHDVLWFKTRDALFDWVGDNTHDLIDRLHEASVSGLGSVTVEVMRLETTAEEAAAVFE